MKKNLLYMCVAVLSVVVFSPVMVSAHQPRINTAIITEVSQPEISKAYYGTLAGTPHMYHIVSDVPFELYVNTLVPDIAGQKQDVSAAIIFNGDTQKPFAVLNGINFAWKKFFEPFGYDTYLMGPEFKSVVGPGDYQIIVWSSNNDSKYSLAIGEKEAFDMKEGVNAISLIPQIKKNFFNESPWTFIFSMFGWGHILVMYILAFICGFIYRYVIKKANQKKAVASAPQMFAKNIGLGDRVVRFVIALLLLLWAVTTTWNPLLLFFSGFSLFEALFSWCAVYQMMGKNTCDVA